MYKITDYSYNQAKKLGVEIKQSTNPKKKIDVYKNNKKLVSIGSIGYKDFPTFMKEDGKVVADNHRRLYKIRFNKTMNIIGSPSYYASKILW